MSPPKIFVRLNQIDYLMTQPLTQRSFVKGVDASTDKFDQPRGSLPRISNLLFTRRGSLLTVDGSLPFSTPTNKFNPTANQGSIVAIQQYLSSSSAPAAGSITPSGVFITAGSGATVSIGNTPWSNPGNITAEDGMVASCTIFQGFATDLLVATGFNFNIPNASTINGVTAKVKKSGGGNGFLIDHGVFLLKANVAVGTDHSLGSPWPAAPILSFVTYGSAVDLWGTTLSPSDVNSPGFGLRISALNNYNIARSLTPVVDVIEIAISYTSGGVAKTQVGQAILYLQDSNPGTQLGEVTGLVAIGVNVAGGTLTPGNTYTYGVSVLDGQQNASAGVSTSILLGGGDNAVQLSWNPVLGAGSYLIQGDTGAITIATPQIGQVFQPDISQNTSGFIAPPTVTFTDKGSAAVLNNVPYGTIVWGTNNTVGPLRLFIISAVNVPAGQYSDPVLIAQFPSRANDQLIPNIPPVDASGGVVGGSGQVPQMIQFANVIIIALGNGLRPQSTDGITVTPFSNTFTATYITWAASTTYLVGDLVIPPTPNGHYYKCTQGGLSQTPGPPAFSTTTGQLTIDGQASWVEAGLVTTSPPPRGAAHIASHAGSLWWLNSSPTNSSDLQDGPSVLGMSDTDNVKSFNPVNRAFIGKDDGSEGMGLASFTIAEFGIAPLGSLIAFKNFTTYQVIGIFGAQDFDIQQLQTNMGCVAPRSIQYLSGFGIVRMAHLGFALCDGVRDKLISEQIRPFLFGSPSTESPGLPAITGIDINHIYLIKADQIVNPPLYIAAAPILGNIALSRLFVYDLVLKAWSIIDLPSSMLPTSYISALYQARTPGYNPYTLVGGFDNGSIQIIQNGASQWNLATLPSSINWAFTTPEVFNTQDPSSEIYADTLLIRGTNLDGNPITVTLNINNEGGTVADTRVYNVGTGEFQIVVGVNEQAISFNAIISGSGRVEIESTTWNVQSLPSNVPIVIS